MLNIRHGIYIIIFLIPLYLLRFSIFGIPTTVLEVMIYILFLAWIIDEIRKNNFCANFSGAELLKNKNCVLSIGIILLLSGVIISTFNSSDLRTSLGIFKGWFIDPFLFFLVFINVIKKEKHLNLVLKSWLASGVVVSLISIFYLLNSNLTFDDRLKAFFLSPNHLAMYLAPVFLVGLFFLLNDKKLNIKYRILNIKKLTNYELTNLSVISNIQYPIFFIIILIPLYFTYSYGAFLGIFITTIWLFIIGLKPLLRISNIKYLIFLIFVSIVIVFVSFNKFDQITNSENRSSFHSRLMIWNASIEIIKDNPFFGIGLGTFQDAYLLYTERFEEPYLEWAVPQPHNIFLAFYLQTGVIGFVGFSLILFWFFNHRRDEAMPRLYWQIINIIMIYTLIHGLVDTTYWKNDLALIFWLIIGMMVVSRRIRCNTKRI